MTEIVYDNDDSSRMERFLLFSAFFSMIIVSILIGMDIGLRFLQVFLTNSCHFDPPDPPFGVREWNGSYSYGTLVFYFCSNWPGAIMYWIRECKPYNNSWAVIMEDSCECLDELPPVIGEVITFPGKPYPRNIGDNVTYLCYEGSDAPIAAVFLCNNLSIWETTKFNSCKCEDEPSKADSTGLRVWPDQYRGYGSIVRYFCVKDTISAIARLERCSTEGKWEIFFEAECRCKGPPNFNMSQEHRAALASLVSEIGTYHKLPCILSNPNSKTKYAVRCGMSANWELVEEQRCNHNYTVFTQHVIYTEAKALCFDAGGEIVQIHNSNENDIIIKLASRHSQMCNTFYIGVEENTPDAWFSSVGQNINLADDKTEHLGYVFGKCLVLKIPHLGQSTKSEIINVECIEKYCYICYFSGQQTKYVVHGTKTTYNDAMFSCLRSGGLLAPITDTNFLSTLSIDNYVHYYCSAHYYVDGHSYGRTWLLASGQPAPFFFWDERSPDNFKENCVVMLAFRKFYWLDVLCNIPSCFICNVPGEETAKSPDANLAKETANYKTSINLTTDSDRCRSGWLEQDDSCYLFTEIKNEFRFANAYCHQKHNSSYLVEVYSQSEWVFLVQTVGMIYGAVDDQYFHLGLLRLTFENSTYQDSWLSGHSMEFDLMSHVDPFHLRGRESVINCSVFLVLPERWKLTDCLRKAIVICRHDLRCPIPPDKPNTVRLWNGDRYSSAIVEYICPGTELQRKEPMLVLECSEQKTWIATYSGKCDFAYEAIPVHMNFNRAQHECVKVDGSLALARDMNFEELFEAITSNNELKAHCYAGYYIGIVENTDVQWEVLPKCSKDADILGYNVSFFWNNMSMYWGDFQPKFTAFKCLVISTEEKYRLKNEDCSERYCFICETVDFQLHPRVFLMNQNDAGNDCESKNMSLATLRNKDSFQNLQASIRKVHADHCRNFWLALQHRHREYAFIDGTKIPEFTLQKASVNFNNLNGHCIALKWHPTFHFTDAFCNAPRCFMCQLTYGNGFEHLNLAIGPDKECPENFEKYRNACFYAEVNAVTNLEAHRRCLNNGSSLIAFHTKHEFDHVAEQLGKYNSTIWHNGLIFTKNKNYWRGGQSFLKYPNAHLKTPNKLRCSLLKRSVSVTFSWYFMTDCNIYASYICSLNAGFLGFFDLTFGFFIEPKTFVVDVGIRYCMSYCNNVADYFTVVATVMSTNPPMCLCAKGISNMDVIMLPFNLRLQDYKCEDMRMCIHNQGEVCGCDNKEALFVLGNFYYIGCYELMGENWKASLDYQSDEAEMDMNRERNHESKDVETEDKAAVHKYEHRCRLACIAKRFQFACVQTSASLNSMCFCFHDLPQYTKVEDFLCTARASVRAQAESSTAKNYVRIFRLPDPNIGG